MSILIKGMEMPKNCHSCPMCFMRFCQAGDRELSERETRPNAKRPEDCPLVPVPPHGRLGDLDALINKIGENVDKAKDRSYDWWYACTVAYDFALAAPTIIPAEEGE